MNALVQLSVRSQLLAARTATAVGHRVAALRKGDERGEGVISAAIAVLIMAVIGGLMFVAYKITFEKSNTAVTKVIDDISAGGGAGG